MKYYIHIDESGPFDESFSRKKASVVGGVCSQHPAHWWQSQHQRHLERFGKEHDCANFSYPEHYHCGPLLAGRIAAPDGADPTVIKKFTSAIFENVLSKSTFGFLSRNVGNRFEYSPQATYVMNLIAALRHAFGLMGAFQEDINYVQVVIAQRTIGETSQVSTVNQYMSFLLTHVQKQLLVGEGAGVALAQRLHLGGQLEFLTGLGDRNAGLIAADFVCCLGRGDRKNGDDTRLHFCYPDVGTLLGDYNAFHARQAGEFLKNKYYGSCLDFLCRYFPLNDGAPDIKQLLDALKREEDQVVLQRELPSLLSVIHQLAKSRTSEPHMLLVATGVAEHLVEIAKRNSIDNGASIKRQWLNFHIQLLAELSACYNHTGSVGPQMKAEEQLKELLTQRGKETGIDATQRQSILISVRNQNLNCLFNDYRFEEAYELAEELRATRQQIIQTGEPDELLGQILGSHGQACAFLARSDPTWHENAIELFNQSLNHFATGSHQEEMSHNFLVTLAWQDGRWDDAVRYMTPEVGGNLTPDNAVLALLNRLSLPSPERRAFEVVNCLRLIAAYCVFNKNLALNIDILNKLDLMARQIGTDHPYEQWLKWIGIIYFTNGNYINSQNCLKAAAAICGNHDFTMQTIGNSITLLLVVTSIIKGSDNASKAYEDQFHRELAKLRAQSLYFDEYIRKSNVLEKLASRTEQWKDDSKAIWALYTLLPFSYA